MTDLVRGASRLLAEHNPDEVAPGFTERLEVASRGGAEGQVARTIAAPYYLTDLGVRRFDDPAVFYRIHIELFRWSTQISAKATRSMLLSAPIGSLADLLDACILLLGDYDLAHEVAKARHAEILRDGGFKTQIYAGVIFAAQGDGNCREAFRVAGEHPQAGAVQRFMANHRLAAAEIKRFGRPEQGMEVLNHLDGAMFVALSTGEISNGDRFAMVSVTANLRALALLSMHDFDGARREVERAREIFTVNGLMKVKPGESARYAAQESINIAQLLSAGSDNMKAVEVLERNVDFCNEHCEEYLGEALSALAYAQYLSGDYSAAIDTAKRAIVRVAHEASPARLRAVREILIGALAESGLRSLAGAELELLESDPLGLSSTRCIEKVDERVTL